MSVESQTAGIERGRLPGSVFRLSTCDARVSRHTDRWMHAAVAAAVFASFFAFTAARSPVPGVNEPHYLSKARHFWDPGWIRGDFFLDSPEAHVVFYQTLGLLTRWFTLEQTAWIGRGLALALLATGWTALLRQLLPGRWSAWWTACVFLLLAAIGNFSGEWMVGGVEGKVFAYAFLFWSLALVRRHILWAAVCAGLAVSFHPVVGVWGLAAAAFSGVRRLVAAARHGGGGVNDLAKRRVPALQSLAAAALLVVFALPGLIPALNLIGGPPELAAEANRIQVFDRLRHHLDPLTFPTGAYAGYAALVAFWLLGRRFADRRPAERWFAWFVAGSVLIALGGLAVGLRPADSQDIPLLDLRAALLKFYPFRLADVLVPLAAAVAGVGLARRWTRSERWPRYAIAGQTRRRLLWPVFAAALGLSLALPAIDRNPSRLAPDVRADWLDACRWLSRNAPAGARVFTPPESWAFKWYAGRAEYVTRKDCPQDAPGIVEWRRRMHVRDLWLSRLREIAWTGSPQHFEYALERLAADTRVTHVIVYTRWQPPLPSLYRNQTYSILAARGHGD